MHSNAYYIINGLTLYRLVAAPALLLLIMFHQYDLFRWLLPVSFFTDLIDGFLARRYKVAGTRGARLDSIADDVNILVAITGLFVFRYDFIIREKVVILCLLSLFVLQTALALIRYKKISSFHTYLAKTAAIMQGVFFICIFLLPQPSYLLFYAMAWVTAAELIEEIILVLLLREWQVNVKGLYWVLKTRHTLK